jgi:WD40 repeat protein
MSWGQNGVLAVSLAKCVYLWNSINGKIEKLFQLNQTDYLVCSVEWLNKSNFLSVGFSNCCIEIWDTLRLRCIRKLQGHAQRVSSLSWHNPILSSSGRDTKILNHDVRSAQSVVSSFQGHKLEVCGLKWSLDGQFLAAGDGDSQVKIWEL